jgi:hypothetical protein
MLIATPNRYAVIFNGGIWIWTGFQFIIATDRLEFGQVKIAPAKIAIIAAMLSPIISGAAKVVAGRRAARFIYPVVGTHPIVATVACASVAGCQSNNRLMATMVCIPVPTVSKKSVPIQRDSEIQRAGQLVTTTVFAAAAAACEIAAIAIAAGWTTGWSTIAAILLDPIAIFPYPLTFSLTDHFDLADRIFTLAISYIALFAICRVPIITLDAFATTTIFIGIFTFQFHYWPTFDFIIFVSARDAKSGICFNATPGAIFRIIARRI